MVNLFVRLCKPSECEVNEEQTRRSNFAAENKNQQPNYSQRNILSKINMKTKKILLAALGLTTFLPVIAQDNIQKDSVPDGKEVKNRNVMLNASADNQPRQINIGLPAEMSATIYENGSPVS